MKRKYEKPYLAVESFQLDAAIAGACAGKRILPQSENGCLSDDIYFGTACGEAGIINIYWVEEEDEVCYHMFEAKELYLLS